ncbi:MAG TPA: FliH/SctL family protein [Candidatus Aquilonibacter sp.]|nr:FliH/SctL family protein [Candidatus Aquilonibacter sp.]
MRALVRPPQLFVYRPAPGWTGKSGTEESKDGNGGTVSAAAAAGIRPVALAESQTDAPVGEDEWHAAEKRAWDAGFREGADKARAEAEAIAQREKASIAEALREFARERNEYFHQVEGEVVALALAIVRKILRREAQIDPLLLSGLVRVALEKVAVAKGVRLRVNPAQLSIWEKFLKEASDLTPIPELLSDSSLQEKQCRIETEHGVTDLNLEMQLKEIEQGLFDLLAQRPAPK